jgi:probable rRNA maturation factor
MTVTVRNRQRLLPVDTRLLRRIAARVATKPVSIVLVTDRMIARLNEQFHHVAGPTDVLSFDYGDEGELIISAEHAIAQARRFRTTPARELVLYVVHGLLHLQGYDDRTARQRVRMRTAERRWVRTLAAEFDIGKLVPVR